jgi:beta-glucanase (GH16 family)
MSQTENVDIRDGESEKSSNDSAQSREGEGERAPAVGRGRHFNAAARKRARQRMYVAVAVVVALLAGTVTFSESLRANIAALAAMEHPEGQRGVWRLAFSDEFEGSELPADKWNRCYPSGRPDGCENRPELQWYQSENVTVSDGLLHLTAKKENQAGFNYTSGMVTTGPLEKHQGQQNRFSFKYGYVEARVKVPKGQGLWPAVWMLPADGSGPPEIDVLEVLGHNTKESYATVHWDRDPSKSMTTVNSIDFADGFHTVGVRWEKDSIEWFYDGQRVKRFVGTDQIPHMEMFLLANLAVGGDWPKSPDSTTQFPADYQIDWIKVWKPITG